MRKFTLLMVILLTVGLYFFLTGKNSISHVIPIETLKLKISDPITVKPIQKNIELESDLKSTKENLGGAITIHNIFDIEELNNLLDNKDILRIDKVNFLISHLNNYDVDSEEGVFLLSSLWSYVLIDKTDYLFDKYQEADELLTKRNILGMLTELTYPTTYDHDFLQIVYEKEIDGIREFVKNQLLVSDSIMHDDLLSTYVNIAQPEDALITLNNELSNPKTRLSQNKIDELYLEVFIKNPDGELLSNYLNDGSENKNHELFISTFINYISFINPSDLDKNATIGVIKYLNTQRYNKLLIKNPELRTMVIDAEKKFNNL